MAHRAVIFDCDGTLVDSERIGVVVLLDVARRHGADFGEHAAADEFVSAMVRALRGLSMAQCLTEIERRGSFSYPRDVVGAIREQTATAFREQLTEIEGASTFVARLALPFCVASSGPREKIELSLGLTGCCRTSRDGSSAHTRSARGSPNPICFCTLLTRWA